MLFQTQSESRDKACVDKTKSLISGSANYKAMVMLEFADGLSLDKP